MQAPALTPKSKLSLRQLGGAGILIVAVGLAIGYFGGTDPAPTVAPSPPPSIAPTIPSKPSASPPLPSLRTISKVFRSGETLGRVFADLGLDGTESQTAIAALQPYVDPRKVRPGDVYRAEVASTTGLASFEMNVVGRGRITLAKANGAWKTQWKPVDKKVEPRIVTGTLKGSFEEAVRAQGADPTLAYKIADVLQWDLDFNRDLRTGDRFEVLFEEVYHDGELYELGDVVALRYVNRGQVYEAYRYGSNDGFYDGEGRPLKKMFLKSPLRFSRVTSGFTMKRFHPILKVVRPHYGIDYGANVGTPVEVTANGTVIFAGWDGGGGKTVKVRHPGGYVTNYLHLSRFGEGVRPGRQVRQGEIIAYVGATGLATAPHLDYRVKLNDRWINPLSIGSVPARPLAGNELPAFHSWRDLLRQSLAAGDPQSLPSDLKTKLAAKAPVAAGAESAVATARR